MCEGVDQYQQMIFKNPLKTSFSLKNILITICVGCFNCNIFFFFKKQAFNGLLKFIHIFKMWEKGYNLLSKHSNLNRNTIAIYLF